jgi:hypothetical protein
VPSTTVIGAKNLLTSKSPSGASEADAAISAPVEAISKV